MKIFGLSSAKALLNKLLPKQFTNTRISKLALFKNPVILDFRDFNSSFPKIKNVSSSSEDKHNVSQGNFFFFRFKGKRTTDKLTSGFPRINPNKLYYLTLCRTLIQFSY